MQPLFVSSSVTTSFSVPVLDVAEDDEDDDVADDGSVDGYVTNGFLFVLLPFLTDKLRKRV